MPTLTNIIVNPEANIIRTNNIDYGFKETVVEVKGLLCFLWVARVKKALEGLDGVKMVTFEEEKDYFTILYRSENSLETEIVEKISETVIAPKTREALGRISK